MWLSQCGFTVTVAASAADALTSIRTTVPDLIVIEPTTEHGGPALIAAVRSADGCADTVVIVLTTQAATRRVPSPPRRAPMRISSSPAS